MSYKPLSRVESIKFAREGATVRRAHTIPHLGDYTVGYHSFNMLAMLRILYPTAPIGLVWAIVEHDMPERLTGDFPAPAKWFGVINPENLAALEDWIQRHVFGDNHSYGLSEEDAKWLRGLDLLEYYLWALDQLNLGNVNVTRSIGRVRKFFSNNSHLIAEDIISIFYQINAENWSHLPDLGEEE